MTQTSKLTIQEAISFIEMHCTLPYSVVATPDDYNNIIRVQIFTADGGEILNRIASREQWDTEKSLLELISVLNNSYRQN
jgi:hypothetical protein